MFKRILSFCLVWASLLSFVPSVSAGDCYVDPVIEYSGSGTISSGVFMRDHACMSGSVVLTTLAAGSKVSVIGFTDGWYRVEYNGGRGWIGQQFLSNSATETGKVWDWGMYHEYMAANPSKAPGTAPSPKPSSGSDASLITRTAGYILLQVEKNGEAWYVSPITRKRYYMKDGPTAYQMMRSFGLGVSEKDYAAMKNGNAEMKDRLRGRIILRVEEHGEAYYIHPKDLSMHYLKNGEEAYAVMRFHSLGITNVDLERITKEEIPVR